MIGKHHGPQTAYTSRPHTALTAGQNWPMNVREVLARNLNGLMERHPRIGSQKLLFAASGVPTSTVGRLRRGEVAATLDTVEALARAFRVSIPDLLDARLLARLGNQPVGEVRQRQAVLAAEILAADLNEHQIAILENTLAALRSSR